MRSLIEPPGFMYSSLANSRQGPASTRLSSTIGVLPIRLRMPAGLSVVFCRSGRVVSVSLILDDPMEDASGRPPVRLPLAFGLAPAR